MLNGEDAAVVNRKPADNSISTSTALPKPVLILLEVAPLFEASRLNFGYHLGFLALEDFCNSQPKNAALRRWKLREVVELFGLLEKGQVAAEVFVVDAVAGADCLDPLRRAVTSQEQ